MVVVIDVENDVIEDVLPYTLDKNAYVYTGYTNNIEKICTGKYNQKIITYNYPEDFLNNNKNKIYSNQYSEVFK